MTSTIAVLVLAAATAAGRESWVVDPAASAVHFHVKHKLHEVNGRSGSIEARAMVEPDGSVLAMVRIPVSSFDSGDANRDAHMRETLGSGSHPFVVFKGRSSLVVPAAQGKSMPLRLQGELDFHGVKRPIDVPATIEFGNDGTATVRGKMSVSLEAFGVERPSLLFVKVDDACAIDFTLRMRRGG